MGSSFSFSLPMDFTVVEAVTVFGLDEVATLAAAAACEGFLDDEDEASVEVACGCCCFLS